MVKTPHEPIDVVDEQNKILYQTTKADAHAKGLLHRTVIAGVRDSHGRWTLVKQAADRQDAGQLVSPVGGHARAGETEEDALRREALEEIGLAEFDFVLKGRTIFQREVLGRNENHYFVMYEILTDEPLNLGDEAVDQETFSESELKRALRDKPARFGDAYHFIVREFYPHLL